MTKPQALKAPFPYFGGKRTIAQAVWDHLGDVDNYIEPQCGSAAVLLLRPHEPKIETMNDVDCYVANFWRATQYAPDAVAEHADGPVNECDLHSRHRWLVLSDDAAAFRQRMRTDPNYYDAKVAGWWCWGLCCWIGSGWCSHPEWEGRGAAMGAPRGVQCSATHQRRPTFGIDGDGRGVNRPPSGGSANWKQMPGIGDTLTGVHAGNRPQLADAFARGRGVHGNDSAGTCAERRAWLLDWFNRLRDRLRTVRVCCGDWLRVCDSESVTTRLGLTGIFFDPPYAHDVERMHEWAARLRMCGEDAPPPSKKKSKNRNDNLYASDAADTDLLVARVHNYCLERGSSPEMRIALCGYAGEHDALEKLGWKCLAWKAQGGYGNRSEVGKANAERERIWFSPHCVEQGKLPMFESETTTDG